MKRRLRDVGGAFGLNAILAAVFSVLEIALFDQPHDGLPPGLGDFLYSAHVHGCIALVAALALLAYPLRREPGAARAIDLRISAGIFLVIEFGVVGAYWAGTAPAVPRFHTPAGKIVTAALLAGGSAIGVALAFLIGRARLGWTRGRFATGSLFAAAALIVVTAVSFATARTGGSRVEARTGARPAARENVIILLADALRRDHLSYFGYERPTSETIDRLLRESYVFTDAYTPSTWTIPSVASLFTGLFPSAHNLSSALQRVPDEWTTLAEHFRSYGYRTAAFVGNPILTGRNGFAQGFEKYFPPDPPGWTYHNRTALERIVTQLRRPGTQGMAWKVSAEALAWMRNHIDEPFFVYIHFMEPHSPYRPAPQDRDFVAPLAPPGPEDPFRIHDLREPTANPDCRDWECLSDPPRLDDVSLAGMIANYDGLIRGLDRTLAVFCRDLDAMGVLDRSHVIFCSDHGEEFCDHHGWFHGNSIYEEMTGCPLAYRPPGGLRQPAREITRAVSMLDIIPTVCERLGLEAPARHQGRRVNEILDRWAAGERVPVIAEAPPHLYSLRYGSWKLIRRGSLEEPAWRLFDLASDPRETQDLAPLLPDTLAELRGMLEGVTAARAQQSIAPAERATDPELLQRLKTLGYVR